ncbi:MAG: glycosyltransferase family 2 protein [Pseudomonadota bacterium]
MIDGKKSVGSKEPDLSVVVPLYNEEDNVERLYEAIAGAMTRAVYDYEIIFVDDGSTDETVARAKILTVQDPRLKLIRFRRNYGQTPAMAAGIDNALGRIIVTMDGDLQNDPLDIPDMVEQLSESVDMVVGWRVKRQDKFLTRKVPSIIANRLIGRVTGVPIKDNGCSLKAYKASVIKEVPLYSELHRFIPAMASITGARVKQVPVRHHARQFGESKYGLGRIYRVLFDLLIVKTVTRFSSRPLAGFALLSLPFGIAGLVAAVNIVAQTLSSNPSFVVWGAVFLQLVGVGLFFVTCGAIGELVFRSSQSQIHQLAKLTSSVTLYNEYNDNQN